MYKSTFLGLNTALRGVLAQQNALDVVGHNIANLNTEGYSRQRAEIVTAPPWSTAAYNSQVAPGQLGTGAEVTRLERLRDAFVDVAVRNQFGGQAAAQASVEQMSQVEAVFQEPGDGGISALFERFWAAADDVAARPDDISARQAFAQAANGLATGFRQLDASLVDIQSQSNARLDASVLEIDGLSSRIAALNVEIADALAYGQQPNDMLDTRDQLMDDLSKVINFTYSEAPTGEVTISFGAFGNLVDPLAAGGFNSMSRPALDAAYANGDLRSGRAFADMQLWDPAGAAGSAGTGIVDTVRGQLDQLVADFVGRVNAQHGAGFDLNGAAGGNIFDAGGTTAGTIQLDGGNDILANPWLVAAASSWAAPGEPGNGGNFLTLLNNVRDALAPALGNQSWAQFYSGVVTGIGSQSASAQRDLDNADVLVEMSLGRRAQVSGVSLDEEMSNMLRFQHAYNASARVLTTMDDALDTIINRMGRVGL